MSVRTHAEFWAKMAKSCPYCYAWEQCPGRCNTEEKKIMSIPDFDEGPLPQYTKGNINVRVIPATGANAANLMNVVISDTDRLRIFVNGVPWAPGRVDQKPLMQPPQDTLVRQDQLLAMIDKLNDAQAESQRVFENLESRLELAESRLAGQAHAFIASSERIKRLEHKPVTLNTLDCDCLLALDQRISANEVAVKVTDARITGGIGISEASFALLDHKIVALQQNDNDLDSRVTLNETRVSNHAIMLADQAAKIESTAQRVAADYKLTAGCERDICKRLHDLENKPSETDRQTRHVHHGGIGYDD